MSHEIKSNEKGVIAWFAENHVAANLLMLFIIIVGAYSALNIKKSIVPDVKSNTVKISMLYPGAAPGEVEQGVVLKIEEAIKDIDGIKSIRSESEESLGTVTVEILDDYQISEVMDELKIGIDGISEFPEQAEKPTLKLFEQYFQAILLQIYGNIDEISAKVLAEEIKQELLADAHISKVQIWGTRDYEITIEVSEMDLRKYGLTLSQVAQAIRIASLDLPSGSIRTVNGDIMLRTKGQAYRQYEFERVVLLTNIDGTRLTLGDIATINDGFTEVNEFASFNGSNSVGFTISAVGNQDIIEVSEAVKRYVEKKRLELPEGIYLDHWADTTYYLTTCLNMMLKNLFFGALLVLIILGLFMDVKIAFWVMIGLPICFLGTFILLPMESIDVSLNMVSLFGFILVLGVVVDDAIVIGESVYSITEKGTHSLDNVIKGAKRVAVPATFGVLTTICAFLPCLFVGGVFDSYALAIGFVVIFCLCFSLIESKWILPAHLAQMNSGLFRWIKWDTQQRIQLKINIHLRDFIEYRYRPFVIKALINRYTTFACFLAALILTIGLVGGGLVRHVMLPDISNDYIQTNLVMERGSADTQTNKAVNRITDAIYAVNERYKEKTGAKDGFIKHIFSYNLGGSAGFFTVELTKEEERTIKIDEIAKLWRTEIGEIPGVKEISLSASNTNFGPDIAFVLTGDNDKQLKLAAMELQEKMESFSGITSIKNGAGEMVDEIHLKIKPGAEALGLTMSDLGLQVREAFYGAEAQRVQRGNEEIKVMVRYPLTNRRSVANLENMYIRTRTGFEVPITSVAELSVLPGYAKTVRLNGERVIPITAMTDKKSVEPSQVVNEISNQFFPSLNARYPDVQLKLDGNSLENRDTALTLLKIFALSLFGIFALLAIPLRSYLQPLIIMSVIPFGIVGAVIGHLVMGMPVSLLSIIGIIALSGVVVNDSLIMVDFINRAVNDGTELKTAVVDAGCQRFRAILVTSLTTFFGVLPMLLEQSNQAQTVIPMAVSLGFGIIFASKIAPCYAAWALAC